MEGVGGVCKGSDGILLDAQGSSIWLYRCVFATYEGGITGDGGGQGLCAKGVVWECEGSGGILLDAQGSSIWLYRCVSVDTVVALGIEQSTVL
jgi:hypothetical protein